MMQTSIQWINGDAQITDSTSPDGTYTVTAYLNSGGATTDFAVLGTVKNNKTRKTKNIYWQYHCSDAAIKWTDDENVVINGVELNVLKDEYDYRND